MSQWDDLTDLASSLSSGAKTPPSRATLQQALQSTEQKLASSPAVVQSGKYQSAVDMARDIAAGGKGDGSKGIGGILSKGFFDALGGIGYVAGFPARIVASASKEIADIFTEGENASIGEFLSQAGQKDFYMSKLVPKSGNKWLDSTIGFVADVASDPLTYVTFGAGAFAGRAGKAALATKAAEASNLAKAPSLLAKIEDGSIMRYGEWALDDFERQVLNVPKGLSWQFGGRGTIGKQGTVGGAISAGIAEGVGKPFAYARARVGDLPILRPLQRVTAPRSMKAAQLVEYGRRGIGGKPVSEKSLDQIVGGLAGYTSVNHGNSAATLFKTRVADEQVGAIREMVAYENATGRKLADVVEQVRPAVDAEEQRLADLLVAVQNSVRTKGDEVTAEFSTRRGVKSFMIGVIDNFVHHSLSDDAKALMASKNWGRRSRYKSELEAMLEMSNEEFIRGPATLRARTLKTSTPENPSTFLGVELKSNNGGGYATIDEINKISMDKLGVKWFEDDAASYLNSYVNSVGNQVRRVATVDRLMDFGTGVTKAIQWKMVPDKQVIAKWRQVQGLTDKLIDDVTKDIAGLVDTTKGVVNAQAAVARAVVSKGDKRLLMTAKQLQKAKDRVAQARAALAAADAAAASKSAEIQAGYATLSAPYRARLDAIEQALANNAQDRVAALTVLEDAHKQMFPKMKNRPDDPLMMAEQIVNKSSSTVESRLKSLKTRQQRLRRSIGPKGAAAKRSAAAKVELESSKAELANIENEIAKYEELMKYQSEQFPDGYFVISEEELNQAMFNGTSASAGFDLDVASSDSLFLAPNMEAWHILDPLDDIEDAIFVVNNLGEGLYRQLGDFNINASLEGDKFRELYAEAAKGKSSISMWGFENPELDSILSEVQVVSNRLKELRILQKRGEDITGELNDVMQNYLNNFANKVSSFISRAENEGLDLTGFYGSPDYVASNAITKVADYALEAGATSYAAPNKQIAGMYLPTSITGDVGDQYLDLSNTFIRQVSDEANGQILNDPNDPLFQTVLDINTQSNRTFESLLALSEQSSIQSSVVASAEQAARAAQEQVAGISQEATNIGRQIGSIKGQQTKLERKINEAVEAVSKAETEVRVPSGKPRGRKKVTAAVAENMANAERRKLDRLSNALNNELSKEPLMKQAVDAGRTLERAESIFDAKTALRGSAEEWEATYGNLYRTDLQELQDLMASMPPQGRAAAEQMLAWNTRANKVLANLEQATLDPAQKAATKRVLEQLIGLESNLAVYESQAAVTREALDNAISGAMGGRIIADTEQGWRNLESLGVRMPEEVHDILFKKLETLKNPAEWNKLMRMYMRYNRFFKITAMMTPGFIVRNAYTAAFNNFVAGVTLKETIAGINFARNVSKYGIDGALSRVAASERGIFEEAYRVVLASGGGQTVDDILTPVIGKSGRDWTERFPVSRWSQANQTTEIAARMSNALSSINKGQNFDAALAQVNRYHFNYSDLSTLDEYAKLMVPFWTFATRNIPLQVVNQVARPSMYRSYESLQRNFPPDENLLLPPWLASRGPLGISAGAVLNPDLPQIDLQEQVRMLADPQRLVSQFNPLVKLPIELMGSRQLATDIPFKETPEVVRGPLDYPTALVASLFGQAGTNAAGDMTVSSKAAYAVPNLVPTLALLQRLIPQLGGKEAYIERQPSSLGSSILGLPYRGISGQEQQNEITRRQFALRDMLAELTRQGYIQSEQ